MKTKEVLALWKAKMNGAKIVKRPKHTIGLWLDCNESIIYWDWMTTNYKIKTAEDNRFFT